MKKTANGWKTCSRGHKFRGSHCEICWRRRAEATSNAPSEDAGKLKRARSKAR